MHKVSEMAYIQLPEKNEKKNYVGHLKRLLLSYVESVPDQDSTNIRRKSTPRNYVIVSQKIIVSSKAEKIK